MINFVNDSINNIYLGDNIDITQVYFGDILIWTKGNRLIQNISQINSDEK